MRSAWLSIPLLLCQQAGAAWSEPAQPGGLAGWPDGTQVLLLAVLALGSCCWVSVLRRRVSKQAEIIRKELERKADLERRYHELIEDALSIVFTCDLEGRLTWLNPAGERLSGYRRGEALGMNALDLVVPQDRERSAAWFRQIRQGEEPPGEMAIITKDGRRRALEIGPRLIYRQGVPVAVQGIARDVTERKHALAELERAKEAAESVSRGKSEFMGRVSREIRTAMNGVMCMAQLALETELSTEQRECVEAIHKSGDSLLRVVDDLFDFSKIDAGKLKLTAAPFPLRSTVEEAIGMLAAPAREKDIKLAGEVLPEVPEQLVGDRERLRQVLVNLVENAVKFTERGEVGVEVGLEEARSESCVLLFSVRDTGIGIPEDKHSLIFDAFAQADTAAQRSCGGTGLGLAISARLVALMGGMVWVESAPGQGSTFHFTAQFGLPQAAATLSEPSAPETPARHDLQRLAILVAEDNAINQKVAARLLERRGHSVEVAANGREALEALGRRRFDLVFMDVEMPEMNGYEATQAIRLQERRTGGHVPILALTAHAMKGDRDRCLEAGMDGYISKPIQPDELFRALDAAMSSTTV